MAKVKLRPITATKFEIEQLNGQVFTCPFKPASKRYANVKNGSGAEFIQQNCTSDCAKFVTKEIPLETPTKEGEESFVNVVLLTCGSTNSFEYEIVDPNEEDKKNIPSVSLTKDPNVDNEEIQEAEEVK